MKRVLHEVTGSNRFCGPTAMATILGISTDDASKLIRKETGKPAAKGVHVCDLVRALRAAGCAVTRVHGPDKAHRDTLAAWLRTNKLPADKHLIVIHGNHYGTILGRRYLCSLTKRQTVGFADIPKRRARVEGWIIVDRLPAAAPVVEKPARKPDPERNWRQKANALAKQHDIEIEVDNGAIIVWGPRGLPDELDPHEGDHYACGWDDAHSRVEEYIALVAKIAVGKAGAAA